MSGGGDFCASVRWVVADVVGAVALSGGAECGVEWVCRPSMHGANSQSKSFLSLLQRAMRCSLLADLAFSTTKNSPGQPRPRSGSRILVPWAAQRGDRWTIGAVKWMAHHAISRSKNRGETSDRFLPKIVVAACILMNPVYSCTTIVL